MSKDLELTLHGWVAADPYIVHRGDVNRAFASFTVIHTPRYRDNEGKWRDGNSVSIRTKAWGALAMNIAASVAKGQPVVATGRLTIEQWEDSEGKTRFDNVLRLKSVGHDLSFGASRFARIKHGGGAVTSGADTGSCGDAQSFSSDRALGDPDALTIATENSQAEYVLTASETVTAA